MNELSVPLMATEEAAKALSLSPSTLEAWRMKKRGPAYYMLGGNVRGLVRYHHQDLKSFAESCAVHPAR